MKLTFSNLVHALKSAQQIDDEIGNLQLLYGPCNIKKGKGTMEELLRKLGKE